MALEINSIVTGKVIGIKDFGAFVALPDGQSGLVHISEIAQGYVKDVRQHLTEGQQVQVKILPPDSSGRMNLSIKRAAPCEEGQTPVSNVRAKRTPAPVQTFEDKLKDFMGEFDGMMETSRPDRRKKDREREDNYDDFDDFD